MVVYGYWEGLGLGFAFGVVFGIAYTYFMVRSVAKKRKVWEILNQKKGDEK